MFASKKLSSLCWLHCIMEFLTARWTKLREELTEIQLLQTMQTLQSRPAWTCSASELARTSECCEWPAIWNINWIIVISGELQSSPQQGRQSKGSSSWWRWRTSRTSWRSGCCCSWWSCSDTGQHRLQTVRTFSYSNVIYCHLVGLSSKLLFAFFIQCRCQELGGTLAELNIEVLFNFVDKDFRRRWIFLICLNDLNLNIFPLHLFLHWSRRMDCSSWLLITSSPD